jgi:hypothetical protein
VGVFLVTIHCSSARRAGQANITKLAQSEYQITITASAAVTVVFQAYSILYITENRYAVFGFRKKNVGVFRIQKILHTV